MNCDIYDLEEVKVNEERICAEDNYGDMSAVSKVVQAGHKPC